MGLVSHQWGREELNADFPSPFSPCEDTIRKWPSTSRRGSKAIHASTLILDFQSPQLWEINVILATQSMVLCYSTPSGLRQPLGSRAMWCFDRWNNIRQAWISRKKERQRGKKKDEWRKERRKGVSWRQMQRKGRKRKESMACSLATWDRQLCL